MSEVYLNGEFMSPEAAKISPMDRGFLFGDGIYEVIPTYSGQPVGLSLHLQRMAKGLASIGIQYIIDHQYWLDNIKRLTQSVDADAVGVYMHISRGADVKRFHAYPKDIMPTVFSYAFEMPASQPTKADQAKGYKVTLQEDLRWKRCHIKSTSLLGNVMHFQQGQEAGVDETILYNQHNMITEASACNVFMVKDNVVKTPPLDTQLLPGITREIALQALRQHTDFVVEEAFFSIDELKSADEVWITSSSKEIGAVVEIDGKTVGKGGVGKHWIKAQIAYNLHKFAV